MLQLSGDLDCPIPKLQMKIKSEEIYFSLYFSSGWGEMKISDRFGKLQTFQHFSSHVKVKLKNQVQRALSSASTLVDLSRLKILTMRNCRIILYFINRTNPHVVMGSKISFQRPWGNVLAFKIRVGHMPQELHPI